MSEEGTVTSMPLGSLYSSWWRLQKSTFTPDTWEKVAARYIEAGVGDAEERAATVAHAKQVWDAIKPRLRWLLIQWIWHSVRIWPHTLGRDDDLVFEKMLRHAARPEAKREEWELRRLRRISRLLRLSQLRAAEKAAAEKAAAALPVAKPPAAKGKPPPSPKTAKPPPVAKPNKPNKPRDAGGKPMNRYNAGRAPEVFSRRIIVERP